MLPTIKLVRLIDLYWKVHASIYNGYHIKTQDAQRWVHYGLYLKDFKILDSGGVLFSFNNTTVIAIFLAYPLVPKESKFCTNSGVHS